MSIPQYEKLSIECILNKGREHPDLERYLPEERDIDRLPRQWVASIVRALLKSKFDDWVDEIVAERNENVKTKGKQTIKLDPAIYKAFKKSKNISSKYA